MKTRLITSTLLAIVFALGLAASCAAQVSEAARKIAEDYKDAVVTVQLVIEMNMSYSGKSDKEERKVSAPGTIIDPSGLLVASLSEIDPTKMYSEFMSDGSDDTQISADVIDVKYKMGDGTEIPADVVLRDRDLDLAFLRPKKAPEAPMKFVDLAQGVAPQPADEVVILSRLGQVASRSLAVRVERVQAIVTKPRTFYVVDGDRLGCPVFALDGKPVGTLVVRMAKSGGGGGQFSPREDLLVTALPCSTVLKAAQQAKDAPPEKPAVSEPKKPEAKPDTKPAAKPATKPATKPTPKAK